MLNAASDSAEIAAGSTSEAAPKRGGKVRLLTLDDLDGRTRAAQQVRDTRAEVIADLGGEDHLSTLEHAAVNNAALTVAMVHDAGVRWLQGESIDPGSVATLVNAFNRTAAILGWQRRQKDVTPSLAEYAARKGAT